jgi:hypothetical protein
MHNFYRLTDSFISFTAMYVRKQLLLERWESTHFPGKSCTKQRNPCGVYDTECKLPIPDKTEFILNGEERTYSVNKRK